MKASRDVGREGAVRYLLQETNKMREEKTYRKRKDRWSRKMKKRTIEHKSELI